MNKRLLLMCSALALMGVSNHVPESHFGMAGAIEKFSDELQAAGVEIIREWIVWEQIEPAPGRYHWSAMDARVQAANDADIEILGYFIGMPGWAKQAPATQQRKKGRRSDFCAPKDIGDFRRFARAVAERYDGRHGHGRMTYIEILNEVTLPEFFDIKHTDYEPWLIHGYQGVKEGNPDARVLIGAFVNPLNATEFVDRMLRDYSRYYDIVSFHVYGSDDRLVAKATRYLQSRMQHYGVAKPIWLTETATIVGLNDPAWQDKLARGVVKRYVTALGAGVDKVFWWPFIGLPTPEEHPGSPNQKRTALAWGLKQGKRKDFHPRPAYRAYTTMTSKLRGFSSVQRMTETQYEFMVHGQRVYVLWCDTGTCSLPNGMVNTVRVTDYLGHAEIQPASSVVLTESPVFVEVISQ